MKIPEQMRIGGHSFTVKLLDSQEIDELMNDSSSDQGDTFTTGTLRLKEGIIYINSDVPQSLQEETLIHEVFHIIAPQLEEHPVQSLAFILYQVLVDNNLLK